MPELMPIYDFRDTKYVPLQPEPEPQTTVTSGRGRERTHEEHGAGQSLSNENPSIITEHQVAPSIGGNQGGGSHKNYCGSGQIIILTITSKKDDSSSMLSGHSNEAAMDCSNVAYPIESIMISDLPKVQFADYVPCDIAIFIQFIIDATNRNDNNITPQSTSVSEAKTKRLHNITLSKHPYFHLRHFIDVNIHTGLIPAMQFLNEANKLKFHQYKCRLLKPKGTLGEFYRAAYLTSHLYTTAIPLLSWKLLSNLCHLSDTVNTTGVKAQKEMRWREMMEKNSWKETNNSSIRLSDSGKHSKSVGGDLTHFLALV